MIKTIFFREVERVKPAATVSAAKEESQGYE